MSHKLIQPINSKLKNSSTRHTFNILHDNLSWMSFQGPPRSLTLNSNKPVMALEKIEDEIKTGIIECFDIFLCDNIFLKLFQILKLGQRLKKWKYRKEYRRDIENTGIKNSKNRVTHIYVYEISG